MFKMKPKLILVLVGLSLTGCTVISNNRVFPKLAPFWTAEAKAQRESNAREKAYREVGEAMSKEWAKPAPK